MRAPILAASLFLSLTAFALAASDPLPPRKARDAAGNVELFVRVLDDTLDPVAGAPIKIREEGGNLLEVTTGASGQTPVLEVQHDQVLEVTLGQTDTPNGQTVGMVHTLEVQESSGLDHDVLTWETTQPVAQPMYVVVDDQAVEDDGTGTGLSTTIAPSINGGRVYLMVPHGSEYSFSANVAPLLTNRAVQGYFAYKGVQADTEPYRLGVLIRTSEEVDLGVQHPLGIELRIEGHGFVGVPHADVFFFPEKPTDQSSTWAWTSANLDDRALIDVIGVLGRGDTLVLLREGDDSASRVVTFPQTTGIGGLLSGGGGTGGAPQDCEPEPPAPPSPWTCEDPGPPGNWFTNWGKCPWEPLGSVGCKAQTINRGDVRCGSPGETVGSSVIKTKEWEASLPVVIKGVPIKVTGSFESKKIRIESYTFPPGANGNGTCIQNFTHTLFCVFLWERKRDLYRYKEYEAAWVEGGITVIGKRRKFLGREPCASPHDFRTMKCHEEIDTSNTCDRTKQ